MTQESQVMALAASLLWLSTAAFIMLYLRRLIAAQRAYAESKSVVEGIAAVAKMRYDRLSSDMKQLESRVSDLQSTAQEIAGATSGLRERVESTILTLQRATTPDDSVLQKVSALEEESRQLKKSQSALESRITAISVPPNPKMVLRDASKDAPSSSTHSDLTPTENIVLQFLLSEGSKTSKEVELKIGKTREHTARLMKKLWQQGYVERETHRIPFTYRAAEALRDLEKSAN